MASLSSLVLNDGQATPVAHTFNRLPSTNASVLPLRDSTPTLVVAQKPGIVMTYRPSANNNDGAKRVITLTVPEYDSVTKKVLATARVRIEMLLPDNLTAQTLKDVAAFVKNLTAHASFQAEVISSDPMV